LNPFFKNQELQIKETDAAFWACRSCQNFAATFGAKVNAKLKEVEERVDGLQENVETHREKIQQNKEKIGTVEKKAERMEKSLEDIEKQSKDGLLEELRAREAIKCNLVMYGMKEPHQSIKDGKNRMEANKEE
jgi:chromosome segregation ATPase